MVTRNSAPASAKVAQPTPTKAKDSPWMPARSSCKKKSTDSLQSFEVSSDAMDLDDDIAFPKVASLTDPASSSPPSSLATAASNPTLIAESSPPPPPSPHCLNPPLDHQATPPHNNVLIVIILLFKFFLLRLHWQTI